MLSEGPSHGFVVRHHNADIEVSESAREYQPSVEVRRGLGKDVTGLGSQLACALVIGNYGLVGFHGESDG